MMPAAASLPTNPPVASWSGRDCHVGELELRITNDLPLKNGGDACSAFRVFVGLNRAAANIAAIAADVNVIGVLGEAHAKVARCRDNDRVV